jgi:hypothetical protein
VEAACGNVSADANRLTIRAKADESVQVVLKYAYLPIYSLSTILQSHERVFKDNTTGILQKMGPS